MTRTRSTGKRQAILDGARAVFARDGYTRASIDAIAAAAEVSTRTIYNHFGDKAELFHVVILESAQRAADAQIEIIERQLAKVTDLERDLIEFGLAFTASATGADRTHFALVRHVNAEIGHVPQAAIDAWQESGPLRVRRALADRLRSLADRGLLRIDDPERAALHLMLLASASNPSYLGARLDEQEMTERVTAGVKAFLYGYGR